MLLTFSSSLLHSFGPKSNKQLPNVGSPKREAERTLFIHAGTHKTASTFIQTFLNANREILLSQGLYIPVTGRTSNHNGHHNIAFQLNSDPRFDAQHGSVSELIKELASVKASRVCLSSEDFEFLFNKAPALHSFVAACTNLNYTVKVVFFLRPQADYAESLYAELVKWELSASFDEFIQSLVSNGTYKERSYWDHCFDYNLLLDSFATVCGADNIIVCPYHNSPVLDQVIIEFLSKLLPEVPYKRSNYVLLSSRENVSVSFADVVRLYVQNKRSEEVPALSGEIGHTDPKVGISDYSGSFEPIDLSRLSKFCIFASSNLRVLMKYGILIPCFSGKILWRELMAALGFDHKTQIKRRLLKSLASQCVLPASLDYDLQFEQAPNVWKKDENALGSAITTNCSLNGSAFEAITADPQIIFPIGSFGAGKTRYLQFDIIFENWTDRYPPGSAQVFWMTESEPSFSARKSCCEDLKKDKNKYTFVLPKDASGSLRLDPVNIPGKYILKYVEIRSD